MQNDYHPYCYGKVPMMPMPMAGNWSPMPVRTQHRKPSICKFFAHGHCTRGQHCNYAHITATKGTGMVGARNRSPKMKNASLNKSKNLAGTREYAHVSPTMQILSRMSSGEPILASDLRGKVFALAKDQHGCRLLQRSLDEGNDKQPHGFRIWVS